jgi:hypothetical protein
LKCSHYLMEDGQSWWSVMAGERGWVHSDGVVQVCDVVGCRDFDSGWSRVKVEMTRSRIAFLSGSFCYRLYLKPELFSGFQIFKTNLNLKKKEG